jgi:hypothetical protein
MWGFDWLTTSFSSFLGRTFQKKLNFFLIRQYEAHGPSRDGRLPCAFAADTPKALTYSLPLIAGSRV